ncbi:MAG: hypothetical protein LBC06_01545 [Rickettsiales bacterium]|jgi:hypothetical protein|nr:hypothetical protein [Rickettsiales bacterium]
MSVLAVMAAVMIHNVINVFTSVTSTVYGGVNYPFVSASVLRDSATNVAILVLINM